MSYAARPDIVANPNVPIPADEREGAPKRPAVAAAAQHPDAVQVEAAEPHQQHEQERVDSPAREDPPERERREAGQFGRAAVEDGGHAPGYEAWPRPRPAAGRGERV